MAALQLLKISYDTTLRVPYRPCLEAVQEDALREMATR